MANDSEPRYRLVDSNGNVVGSLYSNSSDEVALQEGTNNNEFVLQTDGTLDANQNDISNIGTASADAINTEQADITNETFVRANRSSESSSTASGTLLNIFDNETKDVRGEFNSNSQFVPDESGEYIVSVTVRFEGSTTEGDQLNCQTRDVDASASVDRAQIKAPSSQAIVEFTFVVELIAGTTYEVKARNIDSSFTVKGVDTNGVIVRSVVA